MDSFFSQLGSIQQQQQQQQSQQQQQQQQQFQQQQNQQQQFQQQQNQQQQFQLLYQQNEQLLTAPSSLRGPRPPKLRLGIGSHKIRKPPVAPQAQERQQQKTQPQRQPVIIYTVSPKVIHAKPSQFMSLVQRLTGVDSSPSVAAIASATGINPLSSPGFHSPGTPRPSANELLNGIDIIDEGGSSSTPVAQSSFMGILSPNPASLPEIHRSLFTPVAPELNSLGFLQDMLSLSPPVSVNMNFIDNSFLHSPTFLFTPTNPFPNLDFFGSFPDI